MKPTVKFALKPLQQSLLLGLLTLSMTGCQVLGDFYSRPEPQLPANYDHAGTGEHSAEQQLVLQQWWTLFNDSQLNQLVETALVKNNNVQVAVARIEEADAQAREIGADLLPTVELNGSGLRNRVTQSGVFPVFGNNPRKTYQIGLNGSYELDLWGKLRRANEAARAQLLATRYAKEAVTWSLSSLVANHYLMIRSLDAQLLVNEQNLKTAQDSLDLATRRVEGGVATILDQHQAELVVTTLQTQILELKRLRALSEHQLGLLTNDLGLKIAAGDLMAMPSPPTPPTGLPSELMAARPDVRQAEQDMVSANANIAVARAAFYPSISLTAAYGGESIALNNLLKSPARVWSLGLNLNLPIFNGGRLNARLDQATAQQKQIVATYQNTLQTAFTEVSDALVNASQYREQETLAQSKEKTTANILQVAQNRYEAGYTSYLEVLDAQRSHNEASQALVQTRQNTLTASVALFKALGGGWNPGSVPANEAISKK
ncbi:outer membrane protein, multidrug efflux system [Methylophilus rhizosphaerae]|uniref:Outer membrane protein, multidrug efflux system n=1 Tax=Methylophilus rhizosphaerae TaxID=492660 RepID=A0A1G9F3Z9_9PROT|nr:efflux transporter outer membrane subunit [Methylophilus rhizosphaerae]SDK83087.1 outer membrane protein, multidrug efflux system [Methylophilus rhizosphaerae]